jgi:hypothetical protein
MANVNVGEADIGAEGVARKMYQYTSVQVGILT